MKRLLIGFAALTLLATLPATAQDRGGRGRGDGGWQQDGRSGDGGGRRRGGRDRDGWDSGENDRHHGRRHRHHWWEDLIHLLPYDGQHRGHGRDYDRRR